MQFSSRHTGGPLLFRLQPLDQRINHAYQQLKEARRDGDYAHICRCIQEVNALLEQWKGQHTTVPLARCDNAAALPTVKHPSVAQ